MANGGSIFIHWFFFGGRNGEVFWEWKRFVGMKRVVVVG